MVGRRPEDVALAVFIWEDCVLEGTPLRRSELDLP